MKNNLKNYLHNWFISNNHNKYHHYFEEWYNNLTKDQIYYFTLDYKKSKINK